MRRSLPLLFAALIAGLLSLRTAAAAEVDFPAWLAALRSEAVAKGISPATVRAALTDIAPLQRVLDLDRAQPETTMTLAQYLPRVVSEARIRRGQQLAAENRDLLRQVAGRYGVQPRFIVALWGIESDFGRLTGGFQVVPALATLAYDGRRSAYFRTELMFALRILDQEHMAPQTLQGSWAGALGQSQFMPSTFLRYAVDFDGDGHRDLWHDRADVFGSTANYLASLGWHGDETWGRPVLLPVGFERRLVATNIAKTPLEWARLGVRRADGGALPAVDSIQGTLVQPDGEGSAAYLTYGNFRAVLRWNRSSYFAIAVGTLADRIGDG